MMRQLAMRYDAGEELSSITHDLAVPSEAAAQVLLGLVQRTARSLFSEAVAIAYIYIYIYIYICRVQDGCILLQGMLYRCRKCRRLLATQSNVVPVTEGPGSIAFKYRFVFIIHMTMSKYPHTC